MTTRLKKLREEYLKALEFGIADLNQAAAEGPSEYFHAIERHEKLTKAVEVGLSSAYSLNEQDET